METIVNTRLKIPHKLNTEVFLKQNAYEIKKKAVMTKEEFLLEVIEEGLKSKKFK